MKLSETKVFVFIASIILGVLVAMNISFGPMKTTKVLSSTQYMEAINERSKLYNDINILQQQYTENSKKLQQYNSYMAPSSKVIESMEKELEQNEKVLGINDVEGNGVQITLKDATTSFEGNIEEDEFLQWARIVHNTDILEVVNSLRLAGAEAISVNEQRIMNNSEVYCWGPFLKINGVNITAPFYINAIGNDETLKKYLFSEDGYLTFLKYRGINVNFQQEEKVKIPGYMGDFNFKFIEEVKNN